MGFRTLIPTLLLALAATSVQAELQLVPKLTTYKLDGVTFSQLSFVDGPKNVTYQPPPRWTWTGSSSQLVLRPPGDSKAEATIVRKPLDILIGVGADDMAKLTERVTSSLPAGVTNVAVVTQEQSALQICGRPVLLVIVKYEQGAGHYAKSQMFLNRDEDQICFTLTAPLAEFEKLQAAFRGSQHSWQNL